MMYARPSERNLRSLFFNNKFVYLYILSNATYIICGDSLKYELQLNVGNVFFFLILNALFGLFKNQFIPFLINSFLFV